MKKIIVAWSLASALFASVALPATDDFNRTDETPLAGNWTQSGSSGNDVVLAGNAINFSAGASDCAAWWDADAFGANHYSQIAIATYPSSSFKHGVSVRHQSGAFTLYYFGAWTGVYEIGRFDAGSATVITTGLGTPAAGDVMKLEVNGTTLTAYVDGVSVGTGSTTDGGSAITGGAAGLVGYGSALAATLDNWEGGDVGGAAPTFIKAIINAPIRGGGRLRAPR